MSGKALAWAREQRDLPLPQKLLLMLLADHAAPHGDDDRHVCWPSQKRLAGDMGVSERTVRRHLAEMEERGLIEREKRASDKGGRITDLYSLPMDDQPSVSEGLPDTAVRGVTGQTGGGYRTNEGGLPDTAVRRNRNLREPQEDMAELALIAAPEIPAKEDRDFDAFWREYPRKVKKKDARIAWGKALQRASSSAILAGLLAQLPDLSARETRFIPMPATWLNGERWDDEVAIKRAAGHGRKDRWR